MAPLLKNVRSRIIFFAALWIPIVCCFVWRAYHLQIVRHDELWEKAQKKYSSKVKIAGRRGEIRDKEGNLLVANLPRITIAVSPYSAVHEAFDAYEKSDKPEKRAKAPALREQQRRKLALVLSQVFPDKTFMEFYRALEPFHTVKAPDGTIKKRRNQYLLLERVAEKTLVEKLKKHLADAKLSRILPTFSFKNIYVRNHPKGRLAAEILGYTDYVNEKEVAKGGIESALDQKMQSTDGLHLFERARSGGVLIYGEQSLHEAVNGKDVYLTIREDVQAILEEELDAAFAQWDPVNIYAAIADPRTGDILAVAQRPTWDPTDRSTFVKNQTGTRFATETYEPGSVFKPFFVGKALDWGVVTPSEQIDCESGRWSYAGKILSDVSRYTMLTPGEILKKSSNIGSAKIGLRLGDERLEEVRRLFGFGQKTGLPLRRESRGLVQPIKAKVTSTRVPIGYATSVTMLQLLRGYCAIATGKLPKLNVIDRVRDTETGKDTINPRSEPVPVFENSEAHKQLVSMLCTVTAKDGTGKRAAIPGYEVAGKTGTARKLVPKRGYVPGAYFTSFAGFVPARRPELVMVVTVDQPHGKNLGGATVAAPIFKQTIERVLKVLLIPPDFPE